MINKHFKIIMVGFLFSLNIIFIGIYYKMDSDTSENARKDAIVIDRVKNDALDALNEIERAKNDATKNASESKSANDIALEFAREAEVSSQNARQDANEVEATKNDIKTLKDKLKNK